MGYSQLARGSLALNFEPIRSLSARSAGPAKQVQEFAAGLGPVGKIMRLGMLAIGDTLAGNAVGP
ncbi:MAG TPA: hypothetical protein VI585_21185, partial [Candidatus Binatia bacterium]